MTYLSVCSGIEAASVAWGPLGWKAAAFSEIEPFPCAVLAHHFPDVPNLGDMNGYKEWDIGPIDILVGGTPCQSFSVAGLRRGLDDPRGNLMLVYLAIARRFTTRWVVWENVPGVLSSHGGRDFGTFLGGLAECGYGFAYRVLDAQFFGVPQRRRRVFVIGYLGDWRRAAAVLFERESLRGYPPPSREAGERVAARFARSVAIRGRDGTPQAELGDEVANAVLTPNGGRGGVGVGAVLETAFAVNAHGGRGRMDGESETFIAQPLRAKANMAHREDMDTLITHALRADGFDASEDGTGRGTPLVPGYIAPCQLRNSQSSNQVGIKPDAHIADALSTDGPGAIQQKAGVRRLTPRECERLQGFPDDWTLIPYRGKPAVDGPRYKAIGNSMAVPVMRWIGEKIKTIEEVI